MKHILFFVFCGVVINILCTAQEKYAGRARLNLDDIEMPAYVYAIPGNHHNYRSAQITLAQLDSVLRLGLITTVIRLNGEGKDAGGVPAKKERALCDSYGVGFIQVNAHSRDAPELVHGLLNDGRTLIHCRHGFDRTGAMVGYHLRKHGYSLEDVIRHNGWEGYVENKGKKYAKYLSLIK